MPAKYYCSNCGEATDHKDGECVECAHELHKEKIAWMRTKRKAFIIAISIAFMFAIAWLTAQSFSGDDIAKATLMSIVSSIGIWVGTSLKAESKVK